MNLLRLHQLTLEDRYRVTAEEHASLVPATRGKVARQGKATVYVCERGICDLPTTDVEVFAWQLTLEHAGE